MSQISIHGLLASNNNSDLLWQDQPTTKEDVLVGDKIAHIVGDTFINAYEISPKEQWALIAKCLRHYSIKLEIV